jgi:hypothetical protein
MAPQRAKRPGKSARYYAANPEAAAKKNAAQRKRNKTTANKAYRSELNAERRQRGVYGKGGADMSHTKSGKLVPESPKKNRARNGANGRSTRK